MSIGYLEIVSKDVEREIAILEGVNGISFGDPVAALGGARTATTSDGTRIGVRAPMHDPEEAVSRPYFKTDTLQETVDAAVARGAELAVPPMELPGEGMIALYFVDGVQYGLWQD